jgi:uncharacterized protein YegJ (DUF2314 family)
MKLEDIGLLSENEMPEHTFATAEMRDAFASITVNVKAPIVAYAVVAVTEDGHMREALWWDGFTHAALLVMGMLSIKAHIIAHTNAPPTADEGDDGDDGS